MLLAYVIIILSLILSHMFIGRFMKNYDRNVSRKKKFWLDVFRECTDKGTYVLNKRQIHKLNNATMLAAFGVAYKEALKHHSDIKRLLYDNVAFIAAFGSQLRSKTKRACFAYMLVGFELHEAGKYPAFDDLILGYLLDDSVFVRENALLALYSFGNEKSVAKALLLLSKKGVFHSEKLLSDGLLTFTGDRERLAEELMSVFARLNECYRIGVINFMRYTGNHQHDAQLIALLESGVTSKEITCCIIRLLAKFHSAQNGEAILKVLENNFDSEDWEPAAVAASSLVSYQHEHVVTTLIKAMTSKAWYVRINSAKSLAAMKVSDMAIREIAASNDRYAVEAFESERSKGGEEVFV